MPTNTNSSDTFRIYVASLSDYNAGILHGTWIDFAQLTDLDDLRAAIAAMLATSPTAKAEPGQPAEEWAIHDYEGWCGFSLPEYCGLASLWQAYEVLSALCDDFAWDTAAIEAYAGYMGVTDIHDVDDAFQAGFEDAYVGRFASEREFAEELVDDTGMLADVPDFLLNYFDYEAFARDLFMTDYHMSDSGHVFRTC